MSDFVLFIIGYIFMLIGSLLIAISTDQINHPIAFGIHSFIFIAIAAFGIYLWPLGIILFGP